MPVDRAPRETRWRDGEEEGPSEPPKEARRETAMDSFIQDQMFIQVLQSNKANKK